MASVLVEIFRDNWEEALATSDSPQLKRPSVKQNVEKTLICRTLWLGVKGFQCENEKCNYMIFVPNTCKTRCCPPCGFKASVNWQGAFLHRVIPSDYQHIVNGLPGKLRPLALDNRRVISKLMFRSFNKTIQEFCEEKENYLPGIVGVFQTFDKSLGLHFHFHFIKTAGGISLADGKTWIKSTYIDETFVKQRWKAKMMAGLRGLHKEGKLRGYYGRLSKEAFNRFLNSVYEQSWYVWIDKAEKGDALIPYFYITRYLKRMPISSKRIVCYSKAAKIVKWLPQSKKPLPKSMAYTNTAVEFIEKLAVHIPDRYDHHIFYSGLYAPAYRKSYYKAAMKYWNKLNRKAGMLERLKKFAPILWAKMKEMASGINPLKCPKCGSKLRFRRLIFFRKEEIELLFYSNYQILPKPRPGRAPKKVKQIIAKYYDTS